jgi:hypothetical protein
MLQELSSVQTDGSTAETAGQTAATEGPDILLAIEEPELYQHPSRQRSLAATLAALSQGAVAGVTEHMQVTYVTHSPLMVGLDRFEQLRLLRKVDAGPGKPKATRVTQVYGDDVAAALWEACDKKDKHGSPIEKFQWATLKPRLQAIMTPWMAEGFFAEVAVLVEGTDDRAALLGLGLQTVRASKVTATPLSLVVGSHPWIGPPSFSGLSGFQHFYSGTVIRAVTILVPRRTSGFYV